MGWIFAGFCFTVVLLLVAGSLSYEQVRHSADAAMYQEKRKHRAAGRKVALVRTPEPVKSAARGWQPKRRSPA